MPERQLADLCLPAWHRPRTLQSRALEVLVLVLVLT